MGKGEGTEAGDVYLARTISCGVAGVGGARFAARGPDSAKVLNSPVIFLTSSSTKIKSSTGLLLSGTPITVST